MNNEWIISLVTIYIYTCLNISIVNFLLMTFIELAMSVYRKHTFRWHDFVNIDSVDFSSTEVVAVAANVHFHTNEKRRVSVDWNVPEWKSATSTNFWEKKKSTRSCLQRAEIKDWRRIRDVYDSHFTRLSRNKRYSQADSVPREAKTLATRARRRKLKEGSATAAVSAGDQLYPEGGSNRKIIIQLPRARN